MDEGEFSKKAIPLTFIPEAVTNTDFDCETDCCGIDKSMVYLNLAQTCYEAYSDQLEKCLFSWAVKYEDEKSRPNIQKIDYIEPFIAMDVEQFGPYVKNFNFNYEKCHSLTVQNYHKMGASCLLYAIPPISREFQRFLFVPVPSIRQLDDSIMNAAFFENALLILLQLGKCKVCMSFDNNWEHALIDNEAYFELFLLDLIPDTVLLESVAIENLPPFLKKIPSYSHLVFTFDLKKVDEFPTFLNRIWLIYETLKKAHYSISIFVVSGLLLKDVILRLLLWPLVTPMDKDSSGSLVPTKLPVRALDLAGFHLMQKSEEFDTILKNPHKNIPIYFERLKIQCVGQTSKNQRKIYEILKDAFEPHPELASTPSELEAEAAANSKDKKSDKSKSKSKSKSDSKSKSKSPKKK